jgi:hypothetical protein
MRVLSIIAQLFCSLLYNQIPFYMDWPNYNVNRQARGVEMWRFKYLVCLISKHIWIGSLYRYCVRCGKLEIEHAHNY